MLRFQDQIDIIVVIDKLFLVFLSEIAVYSAHNALDMIVRLGRVAVLVIDVQTDVQQVVSQDSPVANAAKNIEEGFVARTVRDSGKTQVQAAQVNIGMPSVFVFHVDLKGTGQLSYWIYRHVIQLKRPDTKRVRFQVQEPGYPCDAAETGHVPITTEPIGNAPLDPTEELTAGVSIGGSYRDGLNLPPRLEVSRARFNNSVRLQRTSQYRIEWGSVQVEKTVPYHNNVVVGSPQAIAAIDHDIHTGTQFVDLSQVIAMPID